MKSIPSWAKLLIKVCITGLCLWYVFKKIEWQQTWQTFISANGFWLAMALLFFLFSKLVAAFRLNIYFKNIGATLETAQNIKLYWLGMFYNLFLPGGIGGDAYKVILINRRLKQPVKILTAAVLLDRISGVAGIFLLGAGYYFFVFKGASYSWLVVAGIVPAMLVYYFMIIKFFPSFIAGFWSTLWMGLAVQALQVVGVYCIMYALHLQANEAAYILIFLLSSIVAVLPFTIGGLGAREIVFIWGSHHFLLDKNQSVCISLLVYLISVAISVVGVYWVYKNPLEKAGMELLHIDSAVQVSDTTEDE